ncbi:MAG: VWA domain-containing protein [Planctomycetes bacterium]|nr:VWA domain-containing protein [Planctomycetota bacterium]
MQTPDRRNASPVRRWLLLPILLSLLVHFSAGGTLPFLLPMDIHAFEQQVEQRFQTRQIRVLKSVSMIKIRQEREGSGLIERPAPPVDRVFADLSERNKVLPQPAAAQTGSQQEEPKSTPIRRMFPYEQHKVVVRPGMPQVSQQYTARGSRYSYHHIGGEDIVALPERSAGGSGGGRAGGGPGGNVAISGLDTSLLSSTVSPSFSLAPTVETETTPHAPIKVGPGTGEVGYVIPLVPVGTATPDLAVVDVRRDQLIEPPRPPELGGEGPLPLPEMLTPLDPDVETEFKVYREPGNPKSFFRLSIRVKHDAKLETIRKNVLFVVDISLSIPPEEIAEARNAVRRYLSEMQPEDKFNVVRFSEEARRAFFTFVNPTPQRIDTALEFIDKVPGQIKTDVYRVLHSVILNVFSRERPCHVFLISDGISTQGVSDTHRIVREIAPITRSNISIFTYDLGQDSGNHYLLDLLSYRSRGRLTPIPNLGAAAAELSGRWTELDDPVLMNLSVNYANLRVDEVYPQILPNLYRKQGLVIYGQCEPGRNCAVQLVGQAAGDKWKHFLRPIHVPDVSDGEPAIAREWARGKIHYLVARLAREGDSPDLVAEVIELGKKYQLPVPFTAP